MLITVKRFVLGISGFRSELGEERLRPGWLYGQGGWSAAQSFYPHRRSELGLHIRPRKLCPKRRAILPGVAKFPGPRKNQSVNNCNFFLWIFFSIKLRNNDHFCWFFLTGSHRIWKASFTVRPSGLAAKQSGTLPGKGTKKPTLARKRIYFCLLLAAVEKLGFSAVISSGQSPKIQASGNRMLHVYSTLFPITSLDNHWFSASWGIIGIV